MLTKIIAFSIKNKLIIGLLTIGLVVFGLYETSRLPIDAVPDITDNQVQVITIATSYGATDIERLVTSPIEQSVSNIAGLKEMRSFSRSGLSLITIVFTDATDIYWARQQVSERLSTVKDEIPQEIGTPTLGPITTGLGEIYQYVVKTKSGYENAYDITELRTIQDWIIRRQLIGIKGVAEVSSFGGKLKQYDVEVNPDLLNSYSLTVDDVFNALEKNNQNTGGSYIEKGSTVLFIRTEGLFNSKDDIENVYVKHNESGIPVLIKNIASVKEGYATRFGAMLYNDEGEVSGGIVMMLKGANSSEVIKNVKTEIARIEKTLPEGIEIESFLDRTKMVDHAISTVEKNLLEGALIVIFILILFLGNFRAGLLVASVIPLSMLFAIIMMNIFGVSGNLMSLGALDFGLIVDGAVIIVEAILFQIAHNNRFSTLHALSQTDRDKLTGQAASRMMNSTVFGQIIILIVYLPILTLTNIEGKMFKPMAMTVAFAIAGAFILSLTYVPMMSALVLKRSSNPKLAFADKIMTWLEDKYLHLLPKIIRHGKITLISIFLLFGLSIFVLSRMGGEFIPALEEGDFAVDTRVLTGSNLNTSIEYTQKAARLLKRQFPEVIKVVTKIGSGEVPTDPMPLEAADMMVILKDKKDWTSAKTFPELSTKMSKALEAIPGLTYGFQFPVQMRFNELMTGARQDVVCKIFGDNLDTLAYYAAQLGEIVQTLHGAVDLYVEPVTGVDEIIVHYNQDALAQYHLNVVDINRIVQTSFAGRVVGEIYEGEKKFDLVVRLESDRRKNLQDIQNLLIPTPAHNQIALYHLADVRIKNGPNQIQRENGRRRIIIGFNTKGNDVQSIVNELQLKVNDKVKLPPGYYIHYGGSFENLKAAKDRLVIAVPIALLLIFMMLYFAFGSIKQGLLIYTAIPLSAIGGVFLLALRGMPFSISAAVGFIALSGVAVLNGIVLISEFNRLRASGIRNVFRVVFQGTRTRLRPVLLTALVASLGFLPMALSNGAGAEVQRPLATVVIGGLTIATFLTLFVLPILYIFIETRKLKIASMPKALILFILIGLIGFSVKAQTSNSKYQALSLQSAIDTALKNNSELKKERLNVQMRAKMIGSGLNIQPTNVSLEYGQLNSGLTDNKIDISQNLNFPWLYAYQKKMLRNESEISLIQQKLTASKIQMLLTETYYSYLVLKDKEQLYVQYDSLYNMLIQKADNKLNKGEINILEKSTAYIQLDHIQNLLASIRQKLAEKILYFNFYLNAEQDFVPEKTATKMAFNPDVDSVITDTHLMTMYYTRQIKSAQTNLKLEKIKVLPEFSIGYFNQSLKETSSGQIINEHIRYQGIMAGIGFPILPVSQRSLIQSAGIKVKIAENDYQLHQNQLNTQRNIALTQYKSSSLITSQYENMQESNIKIMMNAANLQYAAGEIDFMEWLILKDKAIQLRLSYLDELDKYNNSIITLQYLNSEF